MRGKMRTGVGLRQTKTGVSSFTKVFAPVKKNSVLREAILHELQLELARQTSAAQLARDEAISEESRAQNKWDTAVRDMNAVLADIGKAVGTALDNYRQTESGNAKLWQ